MPAPHLSTRICILVHPGSFHGSARRQVDDAIFAERATGLIEDL